MAEGEENSIEPVTLTYSRKLFDEVLGSSTSKIVIA